MSGAKVLEAHRDRAKMLLASRGMVEPVNRIETIARALADAEAGGRTAAREEYAQMAAEIGAKQLAEAIRARGQS